MDGGGGVSGRALERAMVELGMVASGSREGGFFVVIGRKPPRRGQADQESS